MVFAHAGHWLANVAYAAPVIVLVGWLGVVRFKEMANRRRDAAHGVEDQHLGATDD